MAANLGFKVTLLADVTAVLPYLAKTVRPSLLGAIHETNLLSLQDEFAQILTTERIYNPRPQV